MLNINIFQDLEVHHTFITYIDNMAFAGNWTLESIMIVYAGLTDMPPLGPVKRNIQFLYLFENNISFISSLYFKGFDFLQQLDLHRNSLQIFPDVTSLSFTLVLLDLDYNRIKSIPHKFFMTKFLRLEKLYLQSNKIPSFDYDSIAPWLKLNYIDLGMNDITTLPDIQDEYNNCSTILRIKCLVILYMNPINCSNMLSGTVSHIVRQSIYPTILNGYMLINPKYIRCASPPHLCGRVLHNLSE